MTMGCHGYRFYGAADRVLTYSDCIAEGVLLNCKPHIGRLVMLYDSAVSGVQTSDSQIFTRLSFDTSETPRYIKIGRRCTRGIAVISNGTVDITVLWNRNQQK